MKHSSLLLSFLLLAYSAILAETNYSPVNSKVKAVTVFTQGALITEQGKLDLPAGKSTIVFSNIPMNIDQSRIHVKPSGNFKLLAVSYVAPGTFDALDDIVLKPLNDSLQVLTDELEKISYAKRALEEERSLLQANKSIGGNTNGVSVTELQKAADFYRNRIADIDKQLLQLNKKERLLNGTIGRQKDKITLATERFTNTSYKILVSVQAGSATKAELELSYIVPGAMAGWAPAYELHYKDISSPIDINYKGKVFNNTGVSWDGIKLTLSTADPTLNAEKPILTPWALDYTSSGTNYMAGYGGRVNYQLSEDNFNTDAYLKGQYGDLKKQDKTDNGKVQYSQVAASELAVDFEIKEPGYIPSDSRPYVVDIQSLTLPASYKYYCVPKLEKDAFLLARITGWEELNLVDGAVDIYNNETYTGQSYLNTRMAGDTMSISLGRDKKVAITRIMKQDFTQKQLVGVNRTENYTYEVSVRNNNSKPIDIEMYDQVPISKQSDIVVDVREVSDANWNKVNGQLSWNFTINPSEAQKVTTAFAVRYPKYRQVEVRKWRSINCPTF